MSALVGLRVVPAPDRRSEPSWQGGSDGLVGTLIEVGTERPVIRADVLWDSGSIDSCRIGADGMHDLRIYDNAPTGVRHEGVSCDTCNVLDIAGVRWKCGVCYNFDLCTACYMSDQHDTSHAFFRLTNPDERKARVPPRMGSAKCTARGLFPGAIVFRGKNWLWGDQDASGQNKRGAVVGIAHFAAAGVRDAVRVQWTKDGVTSIGQVYRAGCDGKVDLQCETYGDGGSYYPDHLPVVGVFTGGVQPGAALEEGDRVKCVVPLDKLKDLQMGHGEWNDRMSELSGQTGIVRGFTGDRDAIVQYYGESSHYTYNPAALALVDNFKVGDRVKIRSDVEKVKACHDEGRWDDVMQRVLGMKGKVIKVYPDGDICVEIKIGRVIINSICVLPLAAADTGSRKGSSSSVSSSASSSDSDDELHKFMRLIGAAGGGDSTAAGGLAGAFVAAATAAQRLFSSPAESRFKVGERVKVTADRRRAKSLLKGHGGWVDDMDTTLGKVGRVKTSLGTGDVRVKVAGHTWTFNPDCLESVAAADDDETATSSSSSSDSDTGASLLEKLSRHLQGASAATGSETGSLGSRSASGFDRGDIVTIVSDLSQAKQLQTGHGEWVPLMETILGKTGKVASVLPSGDLCVKVGGQRWTLNPACCSLAGNVEREAVAAEASDSSSESSSEEERAPDLLSAILGGAVGSGSGILGGGGIGDIRLLVQAITRDDAPTVREILSKSKGQVNSRVAGKTPLMMAAHQSKVEIVRMLLEAGADVSSTDDDGYTALHYAAAGRKHESLKVLLESGAPRGAANKQGRTALHIASAYEVEDVALVRLLLEYGCDPNAQDSDGDTPLLCAIDKGYKAATVTLIGHPASDLNVKNNQGRNALHQVIINGDLEAVRAIICKLPTIVEERNDGGHTGLHVATVHGQTAIAEIFVKEGKAAIEQLTERHETPLLLAVAHCQAEVANMLLDCGASVFARDERGDTCLHLAIVKHQLLHGSSTSTPAAIRSLELIGKLLEKGADPTSKNIQGRSAEDLATGKRTRAVLEQYSRRGAR